MSTQNSGQILISEIFETAKKIAKKPSFDDIDNLAELLTNAKIAHNSTDTHNVIEPISKALGGLRQDFKNMPDNTIVRIAEELDDLSTQTLEIS